MATAIIGSAVRFALFGRSNRQKLVIRHKTVAECAKFSALSLYKTRQSGRPPSRREVRALL